MEKINEYLPLKSPVTLPYLRISSIPNRSFHEGHVLRIVLRFEWRRILETLILVFDMHREDIPIELSKYDFQCTGMAPYDTVTNCRIYS